MNFISGGQPIGSLFFVDKHLTRFSEECIVFNISIPNHIPYFMSSDSSVQYLSSDKQSQLQDELKKLKESTLPFIAKRIDEARQMGDLSENAEYHAAREDMSWAQSRVQELEYILQNAVTIDTNVHASMLTLGSSFTVETANGTKREYTLVGAQEADPLNGKISNESPLGHAFLGKKKGDKVEVKVPAGLQLYKIVKVQ